MCLALGLHRLVSPFFVPLPTWYDDLIVNLLEGLIATVAGLFLLHLSWKYLRDLFSRSVTIRGQVSRRRFITSSNSPTGIALPTYYISIGSLEFEVAADEFKKAPEGQCVEVTYLPNTRTVEAFSLVGPIWLTPTVTALAKSIAASQDWHALPILADALEEAGCTDIEMLQQCRESDEEEDRYAVVEEIMQLIEEFGDASR